VLFDIIYMFFVVFQQIAIDNVESLCYAIFSCKTFTWGESRLPLFLNENMENIMTKFNNYKKTLSAIVALQKKKGDAAVMKFLNFKADQANNVNTKALVQGTLYGNSGFAPKDLVRCGL